MSNVSNLHQIYKCNVCGNIIAVTHVGGGELVCCGQPMELMVENSKDAAWEKHVPVIEKIDEGLKVMIGSEPHPMTEEHYIEWIEILVDGKSCRRFLKPGAKPEAIFEIVTDKVTARAYCNLHGLWKAEME